MVTLMRFNIFLIFVLIFTYLAYNTYTAIKNDETILLNNNLNIAFFLSILLIISLTTFPITTKPSTPATFNLIPLKTITMFFENGNTISILANILGNVILFTPLGFFGYIKFKKSFFKTLQLCIFTTIFVECIQILLPMRFTDIDDIILNVFGGLIGIVLAKIVMPKTVSKTLSFK